MRLSRPCILSLLLPVLLCGSTGDARAQAIKMKRRAMDTAYVKDFYKRNLIVRLYESTKFNDFRFIDDHQKVIYNPNSHNNLGIGATYRFFTLNLGFYAPFISRNPAEYGNTKYLDLQTHVYLHKYTVDFFGQFYKGYYLSNPENSLPSYKSGSGIPLRPDIRTRDLGVDVQYIFNDKRFSYGAAFYQNAYQKKSAGSFLAGGGIHYTLIKGDSALLPAQTNFNDFFRNNRFNRSTNASISASLGYAYSLIIKKHFFLTGALTAGTGLNYVTLSDSRQGTDKSKAGPMFDYLVRLAAGYNSDRYFAGVTFVRLTMEDNLVQPNTWEEVNSGNFRITVAKRFRFKKSLIPKNKVIPQN